MKVRIILIVLLTFINTFASKKALDVLIKTAMLNQDGVCVFIECKTGSINTSNSAIDSIRLTPCSTFKIWNTLIGFDCHIILSSDELFYKWDSIPRFLPAWNKDQSLKEAFQVSCVPGFQNLARKIGKENMMKWIDTINYGDKDISSGIDDFWLPREGKKSIQISPIEQAQLIRKLINGDLPFSVQSRNILKELMLINKTSKGTLYGKTGSGTCINGNPKQNIGWFVGYVISNAKTHSFACLIKGENVSAKDSKKIIESILMESDLL